MANDNEHAILTINKLAQIEIKRTLNSYNYCFSLCEDMEEGNPGRN
jgi:hypothetical protein